VCGTDLGIPYLGSDNKTVKFMFGDTFESLPEGQVNWRSPVALQSTTNPSPRNLIAFDSAVSPDNTGAATELMTNGHRTGGEVSAIVNDGIAFPNGNEILSYQSIHSWNSDVGDWSTNYSGLAWSPDGKRFYRTGPKWNNTDSNSNPFQMMSMQRDGAFVYIIGVKAGRQKTPMSLMRVPWDKMLDAAAYACWNGKGWGGGQCKPLFSGTIGEPSLRKLSDGSWAMAYFNAKIGAIVTRSASNPTGPWSSERIQVTKDRLPGLYGGFIHPFSRVTDLTLTVSVWTRDDNDRTTRYGVYQFNGRLDAAPDIA
jgi:hypothetical protein